MLHGQGGTKNGRGRKNSGNSGNNGEQLTSRLQHGASCDVGMRIHRGSIPVSILYAAFPQVSMF
jgi:hypothetical protein